MKSSVFKKMDSLVEVVVVEDRRPEPAPEASEVGGGSVLEPGVTSGAPPPASGVVGGGAVPELGVVGGGSVPSPGAVDSGYR